MTDKLHFKSAIELAKLVREKKVSARELLEHFFKRVDQHNPKINAIIWQDRDRARKRADAADAALARGDVWGPLHGVPMTIKESYQVAGSPTTWGLMEYKDKPTPGNALAVDRLERAGVVLFGKTNVPVMLADWQSYNPVYGTTNNPWDVTRGPGGSSGGSAAALAAGLTGIEAGSDIGSSIRDPSHYCGVFGLKPTYGIIPPRGQALPGVVAATDISVIGPMTRGAEDLDVALDAMAGPDLLDDTVWKLELPQCPARSLKDLRIAVKMSDRNSEVDSAYADKLQGFVDRLAKAGAKVTETEPDVDTRRLHDVYVWLLRAATSARTPDSDIERWQQALSSPDDGKTDRTYLKQMLHGATLPHKAWLILNNERHALRFKFAEFFKDWDILLCPVAASAAFPHDQKNERWQRTIPVNNKRVPTTDQLFWAGYSGVVFLPSSVGPIGLTAQGLPVGYQAITAHGRDKTATAFARFVEREICGFTPPPGFE